MNEQAVMRAGPQTPAKVTELEWDTKFGRVQLSVDMVRRYFCAKANDAEIVHFLNVCKYHGLNPWLHEAYLIKYSDDEAARIAVGKDTHARKAEEHEQYAGDEGGIIVKTKDGTVEEREGEFFLEGEMLLGGWAKVYRKDRTKPIVKRFRVQDWTQTRKDGSPSKFWRTMPAHMIAKVAMSQARHEAFPGKYSGVMSEEEAETGPAGKEEPLTIDMPLSVAEAAAQERGNGDESPAEPLNSTVGSEGKTEQPSPAGDVPSPEEQAAIRKAEEAEATGQQEAPPVKVNRGAVFKAVLRRANKENKQAATVLRELTAKSNMSDLSDPEVLDLGKKLGL